MLLQKRQSLRRSKPFFQMVAMSLGVGVPWAALRLRSICPSPLNGVFEL